MNLSDLKLNPYDDLEEISIKNEVIDFILGDDFGTQKFNPFIHRALRRDKYDKPDKCTCWDPVANEGKCGCPYCDGVGYYWDESIIPGIIYLLNKRKIVGVLDTEIAAGRAGDYDLAFISQYDIQINSQDYLLEPHLNNNGFIQYPLKSKSKFLILEGVERRLDWANKEYSLSIISKVV